MADGRAHHGYPRYTDILFALFDLLGFRFTPRLRDLGRQRLCTSGPPPRVRDVEELSGTSNYFMGNDPQKWRTAVKSYATVAYNEIYQGVELVYYGQQGRIEHDFIVALGTIPSVIALEVDGAGQGTIEARNDLVVANQAGEMRLQKPVMYQVVDGQHRDVAGGMCSRRGRSWVFRRAPVTLPYRWGSTPC